MFLCHRKSDWGGIQTRLDIISGSTICSQKSSNAQNSLFLRWESWVLSVRKAGVAILRWEGRGVFFNFHGVFDLYVSFIDVKVEEGHGCDPPMGELGCDP